MRNWADRQLNSGSGQNVLAKDYLPSNWSRPATTVPASTSTTAQSGGSESSGSVTTCTVGPATTVRQATSTTAGPTTSVALDSGITGMVTLGPISPVQREGEPNDKPYSATIIIKDHAGAIVTQVQSGADGRFTVNLPPGTYTLEPVNGNPLPRAGTQDVTIQPHTFAEVTISYDTGIR